jgi:5-(carboxyamino)imidazole ribonucleotide mutase
MSEGKDVAIIMGSDSDWPVMEEAAKALDSFGISYSADVVSAHRMPEEMVEFAKSAASKGFKVIIAGAGGAAHLPGMVASLTTLPVIGVPVSLKNLDGMDSLLSIVQMPGGVPVATVGIDNAKNAGILAARIIGSADASIAKKIEVQLSELTVEAKAKGAQLSARRSGKTGF